MGNLDHGNVNNKNAVKSLNDVLDDVIRIRINSKSKVELQNLSKSDGYSSLSKWMLGKAMQPTQLELVQRIDKLERALIEIESCPFGIDGFPTADEAATWMNNRATKALE